eukprot:comp9206_c0_seq1/m.4346 comp9206_c0_seq1/g.4346  ORF comp9206_c0_seq1/g.4346 comp9206_c0_seq1/m.4346 type:complete len:185 (-) comp9206_c0_seq1:725-1279(-)
MCRFIAAILSTVFIVYSTIAAFVGLFTMSWYTGPGINIGIATNCNDVYTTPATGSSEPVSMCTSISWSNLDGSAEQAMFVMMIIAICFGAFAILFLLVSILFACCILGFSGHAVAVLATLQAILMAATCITMSAHYGWSAPAGASMGSTFYAVIIGAVAAIIGATLAFLHQKREGSQKAQVGSV